MVTIRWPPFEKQERGQQISETKLGEIRIEVWA
jgi:hypothetical protein